MVEVEFLNYKIRKSRVFKTVNEVVDAVLSYTDTNYSREDLVQDAYVIILENIDLWKCMYVYIPERLLFIILFRKLVDIIRKEEHYWLYEYVSLEDMFDDLHIDRDPEYYYYRKEIMFHDILNDLEKNIIYLRCVLGLKIKEISNMLRYSDHYIKKILKNIKIKFMEGVNV